MSTTEKCSLLVVDDEPYILTTLAALVAPDFEVFIAHSGEAAQQFFAQRSIDLILTDQKMPSMSGVQLLEWVRETSPRTVRLLMTGFAELEDAVEAINRGKVYRYLFKPWRPEPGGNWKGGGSGTRNACSVCYKTLAWMKIT